MSTRGFGDAQGEDEATGRPARGDDALVSVVGPVGMSPFDLEERTRQWIELVDRQQITDLVTRRGRAADAKDPDAILAAHVPGSRDNHGLFDGTIEDFVEYLRTHNYADESYGLQRHTISEVSIEFDAPDAARAETYHLAYHQLTVDSRVRDVYIGGRYLDRCTKLGSRWLLSTRTVVYDWSTSHDTAI